MKGRTCSRPRTDPDTVWKSTSSDSNASAASTSPSSTAVNHFCPNSAPVAMSPLLLVPNRPDAPTVARDRDGAQPHTLPWLFVMKAAEPAYAFDLDLPSLRARLADWGEPTYRAGQVYAGLWRRAATYAE